MSIGLFDRLLPRESHHIKAYHQEIMVRVDQTTRMLDLGCGRNIDLASYRTLEREVWGVDFQRHAELAQPEWFRLLGPDGTIPFPDNYFDLVTACWVLEHVRSPEHFLSEVARVLRVGGCLIAHTISGRHYVTWIRRTLDVLPSAVVQWLVWWIYGRPPHDTFPTYYRLNTERQLFRACVHQGLRVRQLQRYADQGYFQFSRCLTRIAIRCDWWLERFGPGFGQLYLTVVLEKT